jgi:hypothetical protein
MAGPYRGVNLVLRVQINSVWYTLDVVEGVDIDFGYEGGPESKFGSRTKTISAGSKKISFTITRWYFADEDQEDLLLDLFDDETEFVLDGKLVDKDGDAISNTTITLSGCKILGWKPRAGSAEDILGEEASGYATDWDFSSFGNSP